MNKKMRDLYAKIKEKTQQVRQEQDKGNVENVTNLLSEINALKTEYENEKAIYNLEKEGIPEKQPQNSEKTNGFSIMAKVALKKSLTDAEAALITGGEAGEDLLVPEDVDTTIRELRKTYISAKDFATIIPTTSLSGSFVFEKGTPAGLSDIDDGNVIEEETAAQFEAKKWNIKHKGKIFPISNVLLGSEKAGLMPYLNNWFVKNAIISENTDIFTALKTGKSGTATKGLSGLKKAINKLDPSCLIGGVIITNQSGFDIMDNETDAVGRPLLSKSFTDPDVKTFKGLPIYVFPDAQLANSGSAAPVFFGNIKSGIYFIEKVGLTFATSEHYLFNKNQTAMRVIEGYDVMQADAGAYEYVLLSADDPKTITTKSAT